ERDLRAFHRFEVGVPRSLVGSPQVRTKVIGNIKIRHQGGGPNAHLEFGRLGVAALKLVPEAVVDIVGRQGQRKLAMGFSRIDHPLFVRHVRLVSKQESYGIRGAMVRNTTINAKLKSNGSPDLHSRTTA